jgi:hypothetical protein
MLQGYSDHELGEARRASRATDCEQDDDLRDPSARITRPAGAASRRALGVDLKTGQEPAQLRSPIGRCAANRSVSWTILRAEPY